MKKYLFALVCCLLFYACKHELERPTWDVDMIVPIVHTKMNINQMITDSNLIINEDEEYKNVILEDERQRNTNITPYYSSRHKIMYLFLVFLLIHD